MSPLVEVVLVGGLRAGERMLVPEPLPLILELLDPVPDWLLPVMGGYLAPGTVPQPVSMSDRATARPTDRRYPRRRGPGVRGA